jgi:hypothetical protein
MRTSFHFSALIIGFWGSTVSPVAKGERKTARRRMAARLINMSLIGPRTPFGDKDKFVTIQRRNDLGGEIISHILGQMFPSFRRTLILATASAIASTSVSQAAVSQNFSPKERAMAGLLLFLMMENGYQPSYGFSQSPQDHRVSVLLDIVGGHLSAPNPPQSSGVTISGAGTLTLTGTSGGTLTLTDGTLTLTGNSGFSETPGLLRGNGGFGQGATTGSTISLGSSSTTGTTQDPSTLVPEPSALLLGGITGSLALLRRRRTA